MRKLFLDTLPQAIMLIVFGLVIIGFLLPNMAAETHYEVLSTKIFAGYFLSHGVILLILFFYQKAFPRVLSPKRLLQIELLLTADLRFVAGILLVVIADVENAVMPLSRGVVVVMFLVSAVFSVIQLFKTKNSLGESVTPVKPRVEQLPKTKKRRFVFGTSGPYYRRSYGFCSRSFQTGISSYR